MIMSSALSLNLKDNLINDKFVSVIVTFKKLNKYLKWLIIWFSGLIKRIDLSVTNIEYMYNIEMIHFNIYLTIM